MTISIGEVVGIVGTDITVRAFENSSLETHFYNGKKYKGVSIQEFISIEHGFRDVVCIIEGEYLDEKYVETDTGKPNYIRKLKARPIGYFEGDEFIEGIKFLPKIRDQANLLSQKRVEKIFERHSASEFVVGKLLKEELPISLPWQKLFNTHIGIFGNTGSGKSNTLTKLYTTLFDVKLQQFADKSKFVFLDFNGEYTHDQLVLQDCKQVIRLTTKTEGGDRFPLSEDEFWDAETLGILFQATPNTQTPFIKRVIAERARYATNPNSARDYFTSLFRRVFTSESPNSEALELLKSLTRHLEIGGAISENINRVGYHRGNSVFYLDGTYFHSDNNAFESTFEQQLQNLNINFPNGFAEFQIRSEMKLISDLLYGSVQYDHIRPLLARIEAFKEPFSRVLSVEGQENSDTNSITVISLRECQAVVKKILPILIAKYYYNQHKDEVESPPNKTLHLIVDEAHNILSQQSNREAESWKDYRLELFEEIIKEGRKFGIFLTLASQRPADISPTIVSQVHNFFIHRLVNDRDLALLENTISTLDSISRGQIPNLPRGACIVTGTSFDIPMLLQIDKLPQELEPDSRDVDLFELWEG